MKNTSRVFYVVHSCSFHVRHERWICIGNWMVTKSSWSAVMGSVQGTHGDTMKHDALELEAEAFSKFERCCHRIYDRLRFGFWIVATRRQVKARGQRCPQR